MDLNELLEKQKIYNNPDTKIDLIYGGGFSIRDYYMESGNPQLMRGASELLNAAPKTACKEIEALKHGAYFSCGSETFFIVAHGKGAEAASSFERSYTKSTVSAQSVAVSIPSTIGQIMHKDGFKENWKELMSAYDSRRMLVYFEMDSQTGYERCTRCNFRNPIETIPELDLHLCKTCFKKYEEGKKNRNIYQKRCIRYGIVEKIILQEASRDYLGAKTVEDLSDKNGDVALLYADINNLGGAGLVLEGNACRRKEFTEAVSTSVQHALYTAILKGLSISENHHFEIVAVGGDDICILIPGEIGLIVGTLLLEHFDKEWAKNGQGFTELSISAGIAVGNSITPLLYMRDAAEQLVKIAKKKAHKTKNSCLDILSLNNDGQWATRIENKLRNGLIHYESGEKANRTMRPLTAREAREMLNFLDESRKNTSASTLHKIADASMKLGVVEGDLWFDYLVSKQQDDGLISLARLINANNSMYFQTDEGLYSAWHDLAELSNQLS